MAGKAAPARNVLFGKYEMGRLLGKGTFAKVYHGRNLMTHDSVAIKVILKDRVKKEGLLEQVRREISVMGLVRHPHIVELKEVMATKSKVYFVMEYVNGGELFVKLSQQGKLTEDGGRKYFQQLLSAVDFCHSRGVSHRDLKPENLLLDVNGNLKVSDFGLSALPEQLRIDGLLHTRCGTPAYVAPEVLRKRGYEGAKSDLWSCGVILFVLLAGSLPFKADNVMKLYRKIFKAEFEFPPWFSSEAKEMVSKLLVVDPEKRASMDEIMQSCWFQKGFTKPLSFNDKDEFKSEISELANPKMLSSSPPFYNAFEFISSMSSGFDLTSLFESKKKQASIFTSKCSASAIIAKLQSLAQKLNFKATNQREFKVRLQAKEEGRKGKLAVTVEVYEVAPELAVVEFSKSAGDTLEYNKFCEKDVRPALKDIVWSWQGENECL